MPQALDLAVPELCFGAGSLSRLPDIVRKLGTDRPSLLIVDPGLAALGERANGLLNGKGLESTLFTSFGSDPRSAQIDAAAEAARQARAGAVIGIGGGSALDVAKLAAAVAAGNRGAEDYALCRAPLPAQALPCVLLPTTAGTGSEATRTAVFTTCEGAKVWAWGPELRARVALLDPELTCALPRHLTVSTGLDALVHAMEAVTSRRANAMSEAPALQAIRLVRQALPRAVDAPDDLEARGQLLLAAWLAGQAIDIAGTGIAHALGHALGAVAGLHHGRAVALSLKVALPTNVQVSPAAHAAIARAFGLSGERDEALAERLPEAFAAFLEELGLDPQLPASLDPERLLQATVREENQPMLQANCRSYSKGELRALIEQIASNPVQAAPVSSLPTA